MEISAIDSISFSEDAVSHNPLPLASDVESFSNLMFRQQNMSAEESLLSWGRDKSLAMSEKMADALTAVDADTPRLLLKAQSELKNAILEVDFTAKVAGQLSQGINKLVNMQ